jgi:hypothetical protein
VTRNYLADLESSGLLLVSDARRPSLATMIAGGPIHGSWWAHPASQTIFAVLKDLSNHRDVLVVKLIEGKNTLVHRRIWPDLVAIAVSGEPWQFDRLSQPARRLYDRVIHVGVVEATGPLTLELEARLLVRGEQFHSPLGAHRKRLEDWKRWAAANQIKFSAIDVHDAKLTLQVLCLEAQFPWPKIAGR